MRRKKKITLVLPEDLIQKAQKATGENLTETVRKGLEIMAASEAYEGLLRLQGKIKLDINVDELRKDKNN